MWVYWDSINGRRKQRNKGYDLFIPVSDLNSLKFIQEFTLMLLGSSMENIDNI